MLKKCCFIWTFVCCFISISACTRDHIGSAANDPDAFRVNGLLISLDENIWNYEDYGPFEMGPGGNIEKTEMTQIPLNSDIECDLINAEISPMLTIIYTKFKEGYTFEDFLSNQELFRERSQLDSYSREELDYEGYNVLCDIYKKNDNTYYGYFIWTEEAYYGVEYAAADKLYEDYLDTFKKSVESIHIENF